MRVCTTCKTPVDFTRAKRAQKQAHTKIEIGKHGAGMSERRNHALPQAGCAHNKGMVSRKFSHLLVSSPQTLGSTQSVAVHGTMFI
jgi:hypothetical protein